MPTEVHRDVSLEQIQETLGESLGPKYRITPTSESSLRVFRNVAIWAVVHVSRSGERTTFRIRPGGFFLMIVLNALYTVPKVHKALMRAFPDAG